MKNTIQYFVILFFSAVIFSCTEKKVIPVSQVVNAPENLDYKFDSVPDFVDEFDNAGIPDPSKWGYDVGAGGWGNQELEYYTPGNNANVSGGILNINALKESSNGANYTSCRMVTKGKYDFLYGRIEVRAKLQAGKGLWPAIWLLSSENSYGNWPASGEIDIMEQVGFDPFNIHCTVHNNTYNGAKGNPKTSSLIVTSATSDFHDYRVDWTPYSVRGFIDGEQYFEYINEGGGFTTWPYDKKFYLILNVAVGGTWGGANGIDDNVFPANMQVDYVRIYKLMK